jgi:glutathione S-transferase
MRVLHALSYSPWSERARWVLLHHAWRFEERAHVPILGELTLRKAAHRWRGRVSVPMLIDGDEVVQDSFAIAEYVDARGANAQLLPAELKDPIVELNTIAEMVVDAGRGRGIQLVMDNPEFALVFMPAALRNLPLSAAASRFGSRLLAGKYHVDPSGTRERMHEGLRTMRAALGGRAYVHSRFSYADVLIATTLQLIEPVADRFVHIDPTMRRVWRDDELAREFNDLIGWRDELYAKHRPVA